MKRADIPAEKRRIAARKRGSVLITAVIVSAVLSVTAGGLLAYLNHEYNVNFRSQHWTQALHLAEAGVEDTLFELNYRYTQNSPSLILGFLPASGWQSLGSAGFSKTSTLTHVNSGTAGIFDVQVTVPTGTFPQLPPMPPVLKIIATGSVTNQPYGPPVTRRVRVIAQQRSRFQFAIFSDGAIDMKGNNVTTNSYNSDVGPYPSGQGALGSVATNGALINVGNADIYGDAMTGPGGAVNIGSNGTVTGDIRDDTRVDLPAPTLPPDFSPTTTYVNITGSTTLTAGSDYKASSINMNGGTLTFTGNGRIRLFVDGNIDLGGNGAVKVASSLTSVEIYVAGPSLDIAGNGIINDPSAPPGNFQLYGLKTLKTLSLSGNAAFSAVIYAPTAAASLGGSGNSALDVTGSIVVGSLGMNGHFSIHFDEALLTPKPTDPYSALSWQEIPAGP